MLAILISEFLNLISKDFYSFFKISSSRSLNSFGKILLLISYIWTPFSPAYQFKKSLKLNRSGNSRPTASLWFRPSATTGLSTEPWTIPLISWMWLESEASITRTASLRSLRGAWLLGWDVIQVSCSRKISPFFKNDDDDNDFDVRFQISAFPFGPRVFF